MYYKRSFVKRKHGKFLSYPHFVLPQVYPMTYALAEAYTMTHQFNFQREIEILCTLRGSKQMSTRLRVNDLPPPPPTTTTPHLLSLSLYCPPPYIYYTNNCTISRTLHPDELNYHLNPSLSMQVQEWVAEYGVQNNITNMISKQVNRADRTGVSKEYFEQMYNSQIIVTVNPAHWEGRSFASLLPIF